MLDIKYRFACGDLDLSEIIKKCQNIMTRTVDLPYLLQKKTNKNLDPALHIEYTVN